MLKIFFFFSIWLDVPRAQNTRPHRLLTRAILHIASLAAHTILNTYKPMELTLRGHLNTDILAGIELGTLCSRERYLNRSATATHKHTYIY